MCVCVCIYIYIYIYTHIVFTKGQGDQGFNPRLSHAKHSKNGT